MRIDVRHGRGAAAALMAAILMAGPVTAAQSSLVNLGVPFYNFVASGGLMTSQAGAPVWISVAAGNPAILGELNAASGAVADTARVPGANSVYGYAQAPSGTVYLGSAPHRQLYGYVPGSGTVKALGAPTGTSATTIWALAYDPADNLLYGGLSSKAGLFSYNPATGAFVNDGSMESGHAFVRALAVSGGIVYAGLGGPAGLVAYNPATQTATNILPNGYGRPEAVNALQVVGSDLFVHFTDAEELVMSIPGYTVLAHLNNVHGPGVTPQSDGTSVAYEGGGSVYELNLQTLKSVNESTSLPAYQAQYLASTSADAVALVNNAGSSAPGWSVAGMTSKGTYWLDNLQNDFLASGPIDVNASVGQIEAIGQGPDGKIYMSSYLSGATAVLDPSTNAVTTQQGPGQAESIVTDGQNIIFGVYPGAVLWSYNPAEPWNWGPYATAPENPAPLVTIGKAQDRPMSMVVGPDGNLYVGTVPVAGAIGGALSVVTPTGHVTTYRNLIQGQSPISLVVADGEIVGSTTVSGGIGGKPTAKSAEMFVWNPQTQSLVASLAPFPGVPSIAGLVAAPDGIVYGLTHTQIFAYDPATNALLYAQNLPWSTGTGYGSFDWGSDASLVIGPDGNLYGSIDGRAFEANPNGLAVTTLVGSGVHLVTEAKDGQVYAVANDGTQIEELAFPAAPPN